MNLKLPALLLACALCAHAAPTPQKPRDASNHKASYDTSRILTLADGGEWKAAIVVPDDATPASKYAAKELAGMLEKVVGKPIFVERRAVPGKISLVVGFHSLSRSFGVAPASLPRDAFVIQSGELEGGPAILLAGRDDGGVDPAKTILQKSVWNQLYERATVFAVYEFLERFAGCRLYFPEEGGMVFPPATTLSVHPMKIYEAPDCTVRLYSYMSGSGATPCGKVTLPGGENQDSDRGWRWANRERDFLRHETTYIPTGHGLARMGLVERFGKTHPEYFSLLPNGQRDISLEPNRGHLCLLNQGLEDEVFADMHSYLKGEPPTVRQMYSERFKTVLWNLSAFQPGYVNLMPQDAFGENTRCRCPECARYFETNGSYSEYVFRFVSRVAGRLKQSGVAGMVSTMAYSCYLDIPKVALPDNVIVQVAPMGPWMEKYPKIQEDNDRLIRDWNRKLGRSDGVFMWNYANDYASQIPHGVPAFATRKIASYYKRLGPIIRGAFLQSSTSYRLYNYLNWAAFGKVMWDREFDVEAFLADHHRKMFGAGAPAMAAFYDDLENAWDACLGEYRNTEMGPGFRPKTEAEVWNQIIPPARLALWAQKFDEAESLARGDAPSLSKLRYYRENLLGAIAKFRAEHLGAKREIEDLVFPSLRAEGPSRIDGELDEPHWARAEASALSPYKGAGKPKARTLVRTAWSANQLLVAFECFEPAMADLIALERPADDPKVYQDSSVEIFLNARGERGAYGHLIVGAAGSMSDEWVSNGIHDWAWKSGARAAVKRGADRYTVEVAIPLPEGARRLVANFNRSRVLKTETSGNELQTLSPFLAKGFHDPDHFATLALVESREALSDGNLLLNGSFEELTGENFPKTWQMKPLGISVDGEECRHGKNSLRLESKNPSTERILAHQNISALKPSTEYTISYFVKYDNLTTSSNGGGIMNVFGCPGNRFFPTQWYRGSAPWTKESFTFKTGPTPSEVNYVRVGFINATGTIWFDDVRLREKTAP